MPKVLIETERVIFDDVFKIVEARVSYEKFNGEMSAVVRRLNFERGDSAAAIVFNSTTKKIILTNQFKYPTLSHGSGWIIEIVAGVVERDETPEATIVREIREEIGYQVSDLQRITDFYVTPGGSSERIHLFYAEVGEDDRVSKGGGLASESEDIQVVQLETEQISRMLENREIHDAKTLLAMMWLQQYLRGNR
jgi:nudix-type nucleoside diphosphatase (YffH/AdpP family)